MNNKKLYTGYTADLKNRILRHNNGKVYTTARFLPVKLIHYEAYKRQSDALRREKYLKTTEGKRFLRMQMRDFLKEIDYPIQNSEIV